MIQKITTYTLLITLISFCKTNYSQDIHFSQFFNVPTHLNPALTGNFTGDYRFNAAYRSQWRSVTPNQYQTFLLAGETKKIRKDLPLYGGITVVNDRAGDGNYNTFLLKMSAAYQIPFIDSSFKLILALQPQLFSQRINYSGLTFNNQFNGTSFDPNIDSKENFPASRLLFMDLNSGLLLSKTVSERTVYGGGLAVHHLFSPEQSFFNNNSVRLEPKLTLHGMASIKVHQDIDVQPRVIYMKQHTFSQLIFGAKGKYYLNHPLYKAAYFGAFYRNKDAAYLAAAVDYKNFHLGVSYDINVSSLTPASNRRGGIEFTLKYIFSKFDPEIKRYRVCPNFL